MRLRWLLLIAGIVTVWGVVHLLQKIGFLGLFTSIFIGASIIGLTWVAFALVRGDTDG